jgi:thioredoxin 1
MIKRRDVETRVKMIAASCVVAGSVALSGCGIGHAPGREGVEGFALAEKTTVLDKMRISAANSQVGVAAMTPPAVERGGQQWRPAARPELDGGQLSASFVASRGPTRIPGPRLSDNAVPAASEDATRQDALSLNRPAREESPSAKSSGKPAVLHVNTSSFDEQVLQSDVPVLVDFYAEWCGPCKALGPTLEELASETPQAKIVKVNIDDSQELAARYRVEAIPCLLVIKEGRVVARQQGLASKSKLKSLLGQ